MMTVEPVDVMVLANVACIAAMFVQDARRKQLEKRFEQLEERVKKLVHQEWAHYRAFVKLEDSLGTTLFERKGPKKAANQG
jgi:chaperonin cofactor prefoldin